MVSKYEAQLAAYTAQQEREKFQALYPPSVWAQMNDVQRAQAWAAFRQQQSMVEAQQRAASSTRTTLVVIFVVVPIALILLFAVAHSAFGSV